jgi:hypothetical protein
MILKGLEFDDGHRIHLVRAGSYEHVIRALSP